jgi:hypothetical protein
MGLSSSQSKTAQKKRIEAMADKPEPLEGPDWEAARRRAARAELAEIQRRRAEN